MVQSEVSQRPFYQSGPLGLRGLPGGKGCPHHRRAARGRAALVIPTSACSGACGGRKPGMLNCTESVRLLGSLWEAEGRKPEAAGSAVLQHLHLPSPF